MLIVLVLDTTVKAGAANSFEKSSKIGSIAKAVVKLEFCSSCLSEEDKADKETLEEVHTYAELENDPRANLPSSFTICSSVMTTSGSMRILFTLLGKDGNKWLASFLQVDDKTTFYHGSWVDAKLPPVFAYQWVRSCMAVNSKSGFLQWVVDGILVENGTVAHVKDVKNNKPTNLTRKFVLGPQVLGPGKVLHQQAHKAQ